MIPGTGQSLRTALLLSAALIAAPGLARADPGSDGLLFHLTGDKGLTADRAAGEAAPNFADQVRIRTDPVRGAYVEAAGEETLSWMAPGNIYAQPAPLDLITQLNNSITAP